MILSHSRQRLAPRRAQLPAGAAGRAPQGPATRQPVRRCARAAALWVALALATAPAAAQETPATAAASSVTPLDLLYSPRLPMLPGGEPVITVGMAKYLKEALISSPGGLRVALYDKGLRKDLHVPASQTLRITPEGQPARISYQVVLAEHPHREADAQKHAEAIWQSRGLATTRVTAGGVYGIGGRVIDTRRVRLADTRVTANRAEALARAVELGKLTGARLGLHKVLEKRPGGLLRLWLGSGGALGQSDGLVEITPHDPGAGLRVAPVVINTGYDDPADTRNFKPEALVLPGELAVVLDDAGTLALVSQVPLEELVKGVVPSEIFASAAAEALKAQAVAARGEVLAKIGARDPTEPYLTCATQQCQVYRGREGEHPRTTEAVEATRGVLMFYNERLVDSVYSAVCGGVTADNDEVWPQSANPVLRARIDQAGGAPLAKSLDDKGLEALLQDGDGGLCNQSTFKRDGKYRWTREIAASHMRELVARRQDVGMITNIEILSRGRSGRVRAVRVTGSKGAFEVDYELPVRRLFGNLNSGLFTLTISRDAEGIPALFRFTGGGWGHGAGMCQTGAIAMAERGKTFREILRHYYTGVELIQVYGADKR